MPKFFISGDIKNMAVISGEDARHISGSLRMRAGDRLTLCDGRGRDAECEITACGGGQVSLRVLSVYDCAAEPSVGITLYQCITKGDKFDGVVRACTELGVCRIVPVMSSRAISRPDKRSMQNKLARWRRIAREAAGQSGRGIIPQVEDTVDLAAAAAGAANHDMGIFFYEGGGRPLSECELHGARSIGVMIGPEGGFLPEEAETAAAAGLFTATLGPRILRTETAPAAALAVLMNITGNMA